jgi:hypothetical protein
MRAIFAPKKKPLRIKRSICCELGEHEYYTFIADLSLKNRCECAKMLRAAARACFIMAHQMGNMCVPLARCTSECAMGHEFFILLFLKGFLQFEEKSLLRAGLG